MRTPLGDQLGQFAIDGLIGDMEDVAAQRDAIERGPAQLEQPIDQRHGRVEGSAWKWPEAGDEDAQAHRSHSMICSAAKAGATRPSATSASTFLTLLRIEASERSRAIMRFSSIDHIHFTCCSRRRAANSPDAVMALR